MKSPIIRSVLIIDDNEPDVHFTKIMLSQSGRFGDVLSANDGEAGIALFRDYEQSRRKYPDAFPPMIVLLDINMPRMNGFEFLDRYDEIGPLLPGKKPPPVVVMLSSSMADADRTRAAQFDTVKDYIVKPMTVERANTLADRFGAPPEAA